MTEIFFVRSSMYKNLFDGPKTVFFLRTFVYNIQIDKFESEILELLNRYQLYFIYNLNLYRANLTHILHFNRQKH